MLIGIISDTHGFLDPKVAEYFAECDEIWHAGDIGSRDVLEQLRGICPTVRAVSGNCDGVDIRRHCPEMLEFTAGGARVLLTHIGGYPSRYAPGMTQTLLDSQPDIMVCGHSHILKIMRDPELNLLHINPGAAGYQGWQQKRTVVRLTIDHGRPHDAEVITL